MDRKQRREYIINKLASGMISRDIAIELGVTHQCVSNTLYEKETLARTAVTEAVRKGIIIKPESCSCCGSGNHIESHHPDYDRPLDIEWLCRQCHQDADKRDGHGHCKVYEMYPPPPKPTRRCLWCGLEFLPSNCNSKYCGKKCMGLAKRQPDKPFAKLTRTCKICNTTFERRDHPNRKPDSPWLCSRKCFAVYLSELRSIKKW